MIEMKTSNVDHLTPKMAWSRRVRRVGGFIQVAFAGFWLLRASLNVSGLVGGVLAIALSFIVMAVFRYGVRATAGRAPRPTGSEAKRIERAVTFATVIQLAASFIVPVLVILAGHPDWMLPSVAITIGPLLLWLDHRVEVPRYRPVGWVLIVGPILLAVTLSGTALVVATGMAAGALLLGTAVAGFHDLSEIVT